ncbi:MAG TPA: YetF domain-containing protein [Fimbriimonas sp.]|nr:YetF domain-containing protein [Fimbriimonas sp.]
MSDWLAHVFDHPTLDGCGIIALKCLFIYFFLIIGLRLLGKRELGQMNIYDLILIIVLGNAVQNAMMNGDNSLVGGLVAATVLLVVNRLFGYVMHRSSRIEKSMVGQPVLLLNQGKPVESRMRREGISYEQLMQALREHGLVRPEDAKIAVLEIDGSISVVPKEAEVMRTKRHFKALRLP